MVFVSCYEGNLKNASLLYYSGLKKSTPSLNDQNTRQTGEFPTQTKGAQNPYDLARKNNFWLI